MKKGSPIKRIVATMLTIVLVVTAVAYIGAESGFSSPVPEVGVLSEKSVVINRNSTQSSLNVEDILSENDSSYLIDSSVVVRANKASSRTVSIAEATSEELEAVKRAAQERATQEDGTTEGPTINPQSPGLGIIKDEWDLGLHYDTEKQIVYGVDGKGVFYLGYEYDVKQDIFYSSIDPWQRNFGFHEIYDKAAPYFMLIFDTHRFKFQYDNKDWMIQIWKGQYGITSGTEVGIYYKPIERTNGFYDCVEDEDMMEMSMTAYKFGKKLFEREKQTHWWLTGFVLGDVSIPSDLSMTFTVTLRDTDMLNAFIEAVEGEGFVKDSSYWVDGLDVKVHWL